MPLINSTVTRFPSGVGTAEASDIFNALKQPDPRKYHEYWNDFDTFVAGDWTITKVEAGAGSASHALAAGDGGLLLLTNDAADDDSIVFQNTVASFTMAAGKKAFFGTRFKVSDATQSDWLVGLVVVDTTPIASAPTDGIYFRKDDGDANIDISVRKDATTGANDVAAIATNASDTYVQLEWYYDGEGTVYYAVDGTVKGSLSASSSYLPDANLALTFAVQNGEAVAKTMTLDWIYAAKER
jgi:hypothetical protein